MYNYNMTINIEGILQLIKGYLLKDLQGIFFIVNLLKGSHIQILLELFRNPEKFAKRLATLTPIGRIAFSKAITNAVKTRYAPFKGAQFNDDDIFGSGTPNALFGGAKPPKSGTKSTNTDLKHATFTRTTEGKTKYASTRQINNKVLDLMKQLGLTENQAKEILQHQISEGTDFQILSSSWIQSGEYTLTSLGVGELTISVIKTGKAYTYPGVVPQVWEAMKSAKGKNGSGAGSVFWALYLRGYKTSYYGRMVKTLQELVGDTLHEKLQEKAKKIANLFPYVNTIKTTKRNIKKIIKPKGKK